MSFHIGRLYFLESICLDNERGSKANNVCKIMYKSNYIQ